MTVTWTLIAVNVLVYALQWLVPPRGIVQFLLGYVPAYTAQAPWTMLTAGFVHSPGSLLHILLNMYCLFVFGQGLEPRMGRWRYLLVYLLSIIGGSVAVWMLADPYTMVVGASGGIFGLFGAFFVWTRFRGGDVRGIVVLIAINAVFGLMMPGISWQAHLGGLVTGALAAWVLERTRTAQGQH